MSFREKRLSLRVPLSIIVTYWVRQQERKEVYEVEAVNIGEGGIFIKTDIPMGIGTEIQLEFSLPPGGIKPLRISGQVVWSGEAEKGGKSVFGKGIRFTKCDEHCRKLLAEYIARYTKEHS